MQVYLFAQLEMWAYKRSAMQPEPGNQSLCFYLNDSFQFQIFKAIFIEVGQIKNPTWTQKDTRWMQTTIMNSISNICAWIFLQKALNLQICCESLYPRPVSPPRPMTCDLLVFASSADFTVLKTFLCLHSQFVRGISNKTAACIEAYGTALGWTYRCLVKTLDLEPPASL